MDTGRNDLLERDRLDRSEAGRFELGLHARLRTHDQHGAFGRIEPLCRDFNELFPSSDVADFGARGLVRGRQADAREPCEPC